jgi:hypothetical protein
MPPPDHNKEMKANYLSFCEYLTKIPSPDFLSQGHKVQLPVIIKYLMKIKILSHNGGVHVHRILISSNILKMTGSWT